MQQKKHYLLLSVLLSFSPLTKSQTVSVGGVFPTIDHSGKLTDKLSYGIYYFGAFPLVNFKSPYLSKDAYFHLLYLEQAVHYQLNKNWTMTGSYLYQRANVVYTNYVNENRLYAQAKYKHSIGKIDLWHRFRFDARFIQNRKTNSSPFTDRVRYQIGATVPINEKWYVTAYEEAFFNTFKNAGKVYGENWSTIALGKKLNERNKIEAGLLYVTWNIGSRNWFNQYYFQFTWINNLNFTKTAK